MGENAIEKGEYVIGIAIILAALLISATAYFSMNSLQKAIANVKVSSQVQAAVPSQQVAAAQPEQAQNNLPATLTPTKEVTLDFLYADWCSHCAAMKPLIAKLEQELPSDRFTIRKWRDEDRQNDGNVRAAFDFYSQKGAFVGFPSFIINGETSKAGEMPEAQFRSWVCSQFSSPKPSGC